MDDRSSYRGEAASQLTSQPSSQHCEGRPSSRLAKECDPGTPRQHRPQSQGDGLTRELTDSEGFSDEADDAAPSSGSCDAALAQVYDELRGLARGAMRQESGAHTLQPTALAHEAFLRFRKMYPEGTPDRSWFLATAAHVFRQVLVDHARRRKALRRGDGWNRVSLDTAWITPDCSPTEILQIHDAVEVLAADHSRAARVVEMRYFGGMSVEETATALQVSVRTVWLDWSFARAWLAKALADHEA